jgi:dTDP-glucose pyrophosphorylase
MLSKELGDLSIDVQATILQALLQMDAVNHKLLIVTENDKYKSLLSIGDIQRGIIKGKDTSAPIAHILRDKERVNVSSTAATEEEIRARMLALRCEFMPVIDDNNDLVEIYFWDDLLEEEQTSNRSLGVPVVIMAGGKGTRLRPITNIIPKPLVPIGNKAIMEHIINSFNKMGCNDFYCSVNYKSSMIKQYFEELEADYSVSYFEEDFPMGTAGSLSMLKGTVNDTFFVSNCDIIVDQDYLEIYDFHKEHQYDLTIVAALKNYKIPYGILEVSDNGKLEAVQEKPDLTFFVNTGMYVLEPSLLEQIPTDRFFDITDLFEQIRANGGSIGVFPISEGAWMDIGNWDEYNKTQIAFKKRFQ